MVFNCLYILFISLVVCVSSESKSDVQKPNIFVILADDLGWNDVSFHGSDQIPTPNIDALAYNGIILNQHYVQPLCTPSRASFLTGKLPIHIGMQHLVLLEGEPRGLPLDEKLMPQFFKEAGYVTHAIGKWHLGFHKVEYTPTKRGFDSFFGYYNGFKDYYDHHVISTFGTMDGYDMRRNLTTDYSVRGKYTTDLFTDEAVRLVREHNQDTPMFMYLSHLAPHTGHRNNPLQAPDSEVAKFAHIEDPERRIYAAMVSLLDKGVGELIAALRETNMLDNSIILFMSDNGAQTFGIHANHGSNFPLRGLKTGPFEGAMRGVAALWSPLFSKQIVSNELMHISDWLPTFCAAAGIDVQKLGNIDGINMWPMLAKNQVSPRTELVHNIDDIDNYVSYRRGDWKYVIGTVFNSEQDQWYGESGEEVKDDKYAEKVLYSEAGVSFAGWLTRRQIKEKKEIVSGGSPTVLHIQYKSKLLSSEKVLQLRTNSIIKCNQTHPDETNAQTLCKPTESPCVFNIREDPCETVNLATTRHLITLSLEESILQHRKTIVKETNIPVDPNADPKLWNGVWTHWKECPKYSIESLSLTSIIILSVLGVFFVIVVVCLLILIMMKSNVVPQQTICNTLAKVFKKEKRETDLGDSTDVINTFNHLPEFIDESKSVYKQTTRGIH